MKMMAMEDREKKIGFGWKRGCVCLNGEGDDDVGDE
jgi:hypothetical protein